MLKSNNSTVKPTAMPATKVAAKVATKVATKVAAMPTPKVATMPAPKVATKVAPKVAAMPAPSPTETAPYYSSERKECKFGINCRKKICWLLHPTEENDLDNKTVPANKTAQMSSVGVVDKCRWGVNCRKNGCRFRHPDGKKYVTESDVETDNDAESDLDCAPDSEHFTLPKQRHIIMTGFDYDSVTKQLTLVHEDIQDCSDVFEIDMNNNNTNDMKNELDEEDEEIIKLEEDYEEIAKCNRDHLCDKVESTDDLSKLEAIYSEIRKYLDILFPIGNPLPFCNHDNDKTINYIKNIVDIIELRGTPDEVFDFISKIIDDIIPDSDFTHRKE